MRYITVICFVLGIDWSIYQLLVEQVALAIPLEYRGSDPVCALLHVFAGLHLIIHHVVRFCVVKSVLWRVSLIDPVAVSSVCISICEMRLFTDDSHVVLVLVSPPDLTQARVSASLRW